MKKGYIKKINNKITHDMLELLAILLIVYLSSGKIRVNLLIAFLMAAGLVTAKLIYHLHKKSQLAEEKKYYLFSDIKNVDKLDGIQFERYLAAHFKRLGYKVELTPPSNDYGVDLVITKGKKKIAIQAKRYNEEKGYLVNYKAVQEVSAGKAYYGCNSGIVVTNSFFTKQAKELAKVNNIDLWDRQRMIKEFNILSRPHQGDYALNSTNNMLIFD